MRTYEQTMCRLWWIPNAITILRGIVAAFGIAILFIWEFLARRYGITGPEILGHYGLWIFILATSGACSDGVDGFLARTFARFGWQTEWGAHADAYSDKFLGLALLFGVPLHFPVGTYLFVYAFAGTGIIAYASKTTRMRRRGEIKKPNSIAQEKTFILMAIKVFITAVIAVEDRMNPWLQEAALWVGTIGLVVALVYCAYALEQYKRDARTA